MKKRLYSLAVIALSAAAIVFFVSAGNQARETVPKNYADPGELLSLVENQEEPYTLIDVRTEEEYKSGHIPTSQNTPFDIIADNLPAVGREELIIVYCRSGRRSAIAAETLKELGFSNVVDFGGITNWPGSLKVEE